MSGRHRLGLWVWAPEKLSWWISTLFMIGSILFALGCVLFLRHFQNALFNGIVFFLGSIFFTSAAYCQYYQAINEGEGSRKWISWQPMSLIFWIAFSQFIGTILFNFNTYDALFKLSLIEEELLVWVPNIFGSILFQISGSLAMLAISRHGVWVKNRDRVWWIGFINFVGCVFFLISACLAIVTPHPLDIFARWGTIFTLIGAMCFFLSAYLSWPESLELRSSASPESDR